MKEYTEIEIDNGPAYSCNNCGAISLKSPNKIKHYSTCKPHQEKLMEILNAKSEKIEDLLFKKVNIKPSIGIKNFILGGKAIFTIESRKTGKKFTFKVRQALPEKQFFVSVLIKSGNTKNYSYLGYIFPDSNFVVTKKSKDVLSAKAFDWLWNEVRSGNENIEQVNFFHEGFCCCCGMRLTTPESIKAGIGPICSAGG